MTTAEFAPIGTELDEIEADLAAIRQEVWAAWLATNPVIDDDGEF